MFWHTITAALAAEFSGLAEVTRGHFRLGLAAGLGAMCYERESPGKCVGIHAPALVAPGSTLFVLASLESNSDQNAISRVIEGLIAGIRFLGAGAIVKGQSRQKIGGLTTAVGIWSTAPVGRTVALGPATLAIFVTLLGLAISGCCPWRHLIRRRTAKNPRLRPHSAALHRT
jgi:putative Mg2+ transporter-C (MgtC) family protein